MRETAIMKMSAFVSAAFISEDSLLASTELSISVQKDEQHPGCMFMTLIAYIGLSMHPFL